LESRLGTKDFAALTPDELASARAILSKLVWTPGERRTRRWIRGRGPRIDLRRALADSLRTGGDVVAISRRIRRVRPRPLIVLCVSDGWDCGDPQELATEIARLQRSCHRLVWLNPLIGTFGYAPLTRGLQAALPFVDDFLPARSLSNLMDLATHLNALA